MRWPSQIIAIYELSSSVSSGDVTESWDSGTTVRAMVEQIDGTRYLKDQELIDKSVYKISRVFGDFSNNIKIVYGSLTLYPIRPWTRNSGRSLINEGTIIAATKS